MRSIHSACHDSCASSRLASQSDGGYGPSSQGCHPLGSDRRSARASAKLAVARSEAQSAPFGLVRADGAGGVEGHQDDGAVDGAEPVRRFFGDDDEIAFRDGARGAAFYGGAGEVLGVGAFFVD